MSRDVSKTVTCPYCPAMPNTQANFKEVDSDGYRLFDCGEHVFRYDYKPVANPVHAARDALAEKYADENDDYNIDSFKAGWDARDEEVGFLQSSLDHANANVRELRRELESALERNQPNADAVKEYQGQVTRLELEVWRLNAACEEYRQDSIAWSDENNRLREQRNKYVETTFHPGLVTGVIAKLDEELSLKVEGRNASE